MPNKVKAPFLTGDGSNPTNLMGYVDSHSLFVTRPKEAIILLMAAYWIFKISFEKDLRQQLVLLSIAVFGRDSKNILSGKDLNLLNVLNKVKKANLNF